MPKCGSLQVTPRLSRCGDGWKLERLIGEHAEAAQLLHAQLHIGLVAAQLPLQVGI